MGITVMVEGTLYTQPVRVYWKDGVVDMHPIVKTAADVSVRTGGPFRAYPDGVPYTKNFYSNPYAFVALMRGTLDEVTLIKGLPRLPDPARNNPNADIVR